MDALMHCQVLDQDIHDSCTRGPEREQESADSPRKLREQKLIHLYRKRRKKKKNASKGHPNNGKKRNLFLCRVFNPVTWELDKEMKYSEYEGQISRSVIDSWIGKFVSCTVPLDVGPSNHHKKIRDLCQCVEGYMPLPRSRPFFSIAAAKHPIGALIHGLSFRSGDKIQLTCHNRRNTRALVCIRSAIRDIRQALEDEHASYANLQVHDSDVQTLNHRFNELRKVLSRTEFILDRRGVTKFWTGSKVKKNIMLMLQSASGLQNQKARSIFDILTTVYSLQDKSKPLPVPESSFGIPYEGEFIVWGPHLFQLRVLSVVEEVLRNRNFSRYSATASTKRFGGFTVLHDSRCQLIPDIIIYEDVDTVDMITGCIDAKLYKMPSDDDIVKFGLKMDNYLSSCEHYNVRKCSEHRLLRGVTFAAIYGNSMKKDLFSWERRGLHCICSVNVHKIERDVFDKHLYAQVHKSLKFIVHGKES